MRTILPLICLFLLAVSCQDTFTLKREGKAKQYCGVDDPLNDLTWLRDEVDSIVSQNYSGMDFYATSAIYRDEPVFFIDICCPFCMVMAPEVKNCQGDVLGRLGDGVASDEVVDRTIIWKTDNGVCEIN